MVWYVGPNLCYELLSVEEGQLPVEPFFNTEPQEERVLKTYMTRKGGSREFKNVRCSDQAHLATKGINIYKEPLTEEELDVDQGMECLVCKRGFVFACKIGKSWENHSYCVLCGQRYHFKRLKHNGRKRR